MKPPKRKKKENCLLIKSIEGSFGPVDYQKMTFWKKNSKALTAAFKISEQLRSIKKQKCEDYFQKINERTTFTIYCVRDQIFVNVFKLKRLQIMEKK